ncbi:hypothetical protein CkaCkLH20_09087 [Colletotrichum karsti]|uniref:Uncharacterized protein n=1 Tax=Colletotrichum karsti TaxID=1095194 RepID=A0A9P6HZ50_9PEZI|nr:uncharacterized protein CkaCkLH20_09087 [Colletotrichum karsti]KAF9873274.1 hypothetical protein CkaCkLH20_09087 [Colletotrichum karsti]
MDDTETNDDPGRPIREGCGLVFIAAGNTFGNGKAGESRTQIAIVKRVIFFVKKALAVRLRYRDLHPKTIHYQKKVADMVMTDKSTAPQNASHSLVTLHAIGNIVNRCRIARRNFIHRGGDPYPPAPTIGEDETESEFLAREHLECALTEMWTVLDYLHEL